MSNRVKIKFSVKKFLYLLSVFIMIISVFQSCEKEVYTGAPTEPVVRSFGKFYVESDPSQAKIYVDNKNTGYVTPDTVNWLEEGSHVVTLKHELFGDTTFTINIPANTSINKYIDYVNNPNFYGTISCISKPVGASIFINDENTYSTTPAIFTKLPGDYKIKYTYPEHRADSTNIKVHGKKKEIVNIILEDTSKWVSYKVSNSRIPSNIISAITIDKQNNKWIATRDRGLVRFDGKNWTVFNTTNSPIIDDFIYCVGTSDDNAVWIGTNAGLSVYREGVWQTFSESFLHQYITDIAFGNNGVVWVATQSGLAKYDSGHWQFYSTQNSNLAGSFVTCVTVDSKGRVWAGCSGFGVSMFDGLVWKTYDVVRMNVNPVIGNYILYIAADKNDNIWVAHGINYKQGIEGGLTKFNGESWSELTYPDVLTTNIQSIYVDDFNTVWIGTTAGLAEVTEQDILTTYSVQNSQIPVGRVTGVLVENNNRVWVTTLTSGIAKYKR